MNLVFWLFFDPITFILGSVGAYFIFAELSALEKLPPLQDIGKILKKRWYAFFALAIAIIFFFYRLFTVPLQ